MTRRPVSFRSRLALVYSGILATVLGLSGAGLYFVVRAQMIRHHDGELAETAAAVEEVLAQHEDCADLTPEQVQELNRYSKLVLFHSAGGQPDVFYRSPDVASVPGARELAARPELLEESPGYRMFVEGHDQVRVYSVPYRSRAGRQGVIRVMERMGDVELPLRNLRLGLLFLSPAAIALAALVTWSLARRALAPVVEVTALAREIEATQLSRRLPAPAVPDEIGRLVETFNQMIARLESSFEAMKRFTADASHELRSPLANVKSTVELALGRPRSDEEYRSALASVGEEAERLRRIVEDLLLLARADSGRLPFEKEEVRLDVLAREVVESFGPRALEAGLRVEAAAESEVVVLGDERWLRQLVQNLVENAVRFSPARGSGKPPALVAIGVRADGEDALLIVEDEGPGIPEAERDRIFERFYRVDASRQRGAGTGAGLGLAICSWIVDAHRGRIDASGRADGGTAFRVRLPRA
ncbi:MAG TPA: heavy metal sensor histidine kinase [Thermoanaerobaculia bacterium]|nr:heavy metal sensor histidine kinase [Thermoanaerobaculia bacterium]HQN07373.1 heavy metal sensor histidine kinase [Thermoanaerobaculia bacterium]HQP85416.1 heavy metal sensor histidine kinase [Thermoanaerobaculia bacterium]